LGVPYHVCGTVHSKEGETMKKDDIHIRISAEDKKVLKKKAETEGRTLSNFILWGLRKLLDCK